MVSVVKAETIPRQEWCDGKGIYRCFPAAFLPTSAVQDFALMLRRVMVAA
jgi:hypothetical protein